MASAKTDFLGLIVFPDIEGVYQREIRVALVSGTDGKNSNMHLIDAAIRNLSDTLRGLAKVASSGKYEDLIGTPDAVKIATQEAAGIVKPDGDTILVMKDGTIKAAVKVALATVDAPGIVSPDGDTILVDEKGNIRAAVKVNIATTDMAGIVMPDGDSIQVDEAGRIKTTFPETYSKEQVDRMLYDISNLLMTGTDFEMLCTSTNSLMGEENTYSEIGANIVLINDLATELLK